MNSVKKVVYFDESTAINILIKKKNGIKSSKKVTKADVKGSISSEFKIPILARVKFLFTGKFDYSSEKTISNQVLSDFLNLVSDSNIHLNKNVELQKMPNSISAFKHMSLFTTMMGESMNGINVNDMENILRKVSGYYTYITDNAIYRFNEEAFQANYKAFDLMVTNVDIYCIKASKKTVHDFDHKQLFKEYYIEDNNVENTYTFVDESLLNLDKENNAEIEYDVYDVILAEVSNEQKNI